MSSILSIDAVNLDEPRDCVVIGAGMAGLVAARDLRERGMKVTVLEGRSRLGGRLYTRAYSGTDHQVDFGGQFLDLEHQVDLRREIERYGIETELPVPAGSAVWLTGGERRKGVLPIPAEEIPDLERAVFACYEAARRIDPSVALDLQELDDLDVSWEQFLEPLGLPAATTDFLSTVPGYYGLRFPGEASALFLLQQFAVADFSPSKFLWGEHSRSTQGMGQLIYAIAGDCEEIVVDAAVSLVSRTDGGVAVTTRSGATIKAKSAVLATPLNTWSEIRFEPEIDPAKTKASLEEHAPSSGAKVWILSGEGDEDVIAGVPSTGGLLALLQQYDIPEGRLKIIWTCLPLDEDNGGIEGALASLSPGTTFLSTDHHDWNGDEFSKGTWSCPGPGMLSKSHSELSRAEGNLFFAGSDISRSYMCWIGGAVETGRRAAAEVGNLLGQAEAHAA